MSNRAGTALPAPPAVFRRHPQARIFGPDGAETDAGQPLARIGDSPAPRALANAFAAAEAAGVSGKAVTPFLLGFIVGESGGRSLEVNLDLARNNVRLAGQIATAWSELQSKA